MRVTMQQLAGWMSSKEDEHLEFKEAKSNFHFEKLVKYCSALANEGGGHMVLGVSDRRPRKIVGSDAFQDLERTKAGLIERLHLRMDADELTTADGRVLVFTVPSRPIGTPIQVEGAYWMRAGEDLVPMTPDLLKRIFDEAQPDFSATVCAGALLTDLDDRAIERFRTMWQTRAGDRDLGARSKQQLLEDAELTIDGGITYAALVLLGTYRGLGRHLAQAEVIFEYREAEESIAHQARKEYREGFLLYGDDLWSTIDLRNTTFSVQEGFFRREIRAFNEAALREAVLNAISHRDYRRAGSVFVKQWPKRIQVTSPGGLPPEITLENILFRQSPRNRRIAEALARCGLVERSGQGADRMFETSIREGKLPPDFVGTDQHQVSIMFHSEVRDPSFLAFLEDLHRERQSLIRTDDLVVLDAIHRELPVPKVLESRLPELVELGALERVARKRFVLSKRYYDRLEKTGQYTRRRGLERPRLKELLVQHIEQAGTKGASFEELTDVLPDVDRNALKVLLRELREKGRIHPRGRTKAARWFGGPSASHRKLEH